jgi:hypothetical protein
MLRRPISVEGRQATRGRSWGLPGANGWDLVSMYQMAVASSRATSTRATFDPRCLPSRFLFRSYRSRYSGCRDAWVAASMSAQRRYLGPFLGSRVHPAGRAGR